MNPIETATRAEQVILFRQASTVLHWHTEIAEF